MPAVVHLAGAPTARPGAGARARVRKDQRIFQAKSNDAVGTVKDVPDVASSPQETNDSCSSPSSAPELEPELQPEPELQTELEPEPDPNIIQVKSNVAMGKSVKLWPFLKENILCAGDLTVCVIFRNFDAKVLQTSPLRACF